MIKEREMRFRRGNCLSLASRLLTFKEALEHDQVCLPQGELVSNDSLLSSYLFTQIKQTITDKSGPKFIPKRKNAAPPSTNNQSKSVTPRQPVTPLPPLDSEESIPNKNLSPPRPTASKVLPTTASNSSPGSLFGPSDPSLRFSQPSSSAESSQPFSSFAFTPRDPSATQGTSVGPSSQPPQLSQLPSSPQVGSSQPPRQTRDSALSKPASSSRIDSLDTPAITVAKPTSGTKGKGKGKGNVNGKGKEKEKNSVEDTQEDIDVGPGGGTSQDEGRTGSRKRATKARKVGKKGKEAEIVDGESREESASDGEAQDAPPSPNARTTRRTSQPRKRAAPKKSAREDDGTGGTGGTGGENGDDGQSSSEDEYDKIKPKKRRVRAPPKRGKVDEMLFGDAESDGNGSEDGEGEVEAGSDGEPRKGRKKRSKKDVDEPLPIVDPSQTTMSQLADPNLKFDLGRPSERTLFFEKQKVDRKTALKLKRQKMKARQKRKEQGLDSGSEDDPVDGNGARGEVLPGTTRDKGKGRAMADGLGSRETSPQVLDAAKAMALIGGIRGMDQDDGRDQSAGSEHGDSAMTDAIAGSSRKQTVEDEEKMDETDDGEDDYGDLVETTYAPQMRIVNGQLVIDEESLQIDRSQVRPFLRLLCGIYLWTLMHLIMYSQRIQDLEKSWRSLLKIASSIVAHSAKNLEKRRSGV